MAELNGIEVLNRLLSQKSPIVKTRMREESKTICRPRFGAPGEFAGDDCWTEYKLIPEDYHDFARAISSEVVLINEPAMHAERLRGLPERPLLAWQTYKNCADAQLSISLSLAVSGTSGYTFTKTNGVSTTIAGNVSYSLQTAYGTFGTGLNVSRSVSTSTSVSESKSETETRSLSSTISVGPKKHGRIELLAYETTVEIPFSAKLVLDGAVDANKSGVAKASQLLTEAERTVPFEGILRVTGVSVGRTSTADLPGVPSCEGQTGQTSIISSQTNLAPGSITEQHLERFRPMTELSFERGVAQVTTAAARPQTSSDGDTIGPADGISYQIIASSRIIRMTPACGFNDLGLPNGGAFLVETRQYSQYESGNLIAQWLTTAETFEACVPV